MDGGDVDQVEDGVAVLEVRLFRGKRLVDDRQQVAVERPRVFEGLVVFLGGEIVVRAYHSLAAAGTTLEPLVVFRVSVGGGAGHGVDRDVLVAVQGRLDGGAIGELLLR